MKHVKLLIVTSLAIVIGVSCFGMAYAANNGIEFEDNGAPVGFVKLTPYFEDNDDSPTANFAVVSSSTVVGNGQADIYFVDSVDNTSVSQTYCYLRYDTNLIDADLIITATFTFKNATLVSDDDLYVYMHIGSYSAKGKVVDGEAVLSGFKLTPDAESGFIKINSIKVINGNETAAEIDANIEMSFRAAGGSN